MLGNLYNNMGIIKIIKKDYQGAMNEFKKSYVAYENAKCIEMKKEVEKNMEIALIKFKSM